MNSRGQPSDQEFAFDLALGLLVGGLLATIHAIKLVDWWTRRKS